MLHVLLFEDRSVIVYLEHIYIMSYACLPGFIKQRFFSVFANLSGLPVMHITFWFKVYAVIKLFSFFLPLWRNFLGLEKILLLFPQQTQGSWLVIPYRQLLFIGFWPVVLWPQYPDGNKKHHEITICLTFLVILGAFFFKIHTPGPPLVEIGSTLLAFAFN